MVGIYCCNGFCVGFHSSCCGYRVTQYSAHSGPRVEDKFLLGASDLECPKPDDSHAATLGKLSGLLRMQARPLWSWQPLCRGRHCSHSVCTAALRPIVGHAGALCIWPDNRADGIELDDTRVLVRCLSDRAIVLLGFAIFFPFISIRNHSYIILSHTSLNGHWYSRGSIVASPAGS